jgi:hypothetical protein
MDFDEAPRVDDFGGLFDGDIQNHKYDDHAFEDVFISPTVATKRLEDVGVDRFLANTSDSVYLADTIVLVLHGTPIYVPVTKRDKFKRMKAAIDAREVATHAVFSTLHSNNSLTESSTVSQVVIQCSDIADEISTPRPSATFALCIGNTATVKTVDWSEVSQLVDGELYTHLSTNVGPYNDPNASLMAGMASQRLSVFPWLVATSGNDYSIVYIPVVDITGDNAREIVRLMAKNWAMWNVGQHARINFNKVFQLGQLTISKTSTDPTWRLDVNTAVFVS